MNVQIKRSIQAFLSFLFGAVTLYFGGLFTLTVLGTSTAAGLIAPIILGPIIVMVIFWKTATTRTRTARTTGYIIAAAFTTGFLFAAILWLFLVGAAVRPIANMG